MSTPFRGNIHRGAGAVARWPGVCIVTPNVEGNTTAIDSLYAHLDSRPSADAIETMIQPLLEDLKAIGAILQTSTGGIAFTYGPMLITADGQIVIKGASNQLKRENLPLKASSIAITLDKDTPSTPVHPYDLQEGISPGAGLSLVRNDIAAEKSPGAQASTEQRQEKGATATSASEVAQESISNVQTEASSPAVPSITEVPEKPVENPIVEEVPDPASGADLTQLPVDNARKEISAPSILMATFAPPDGKPLPLSDSESNEKYANDHRVEVTGVRCSRGHFNNPEASFCMVCGLPITHLNDDLVKGFRPTLGFIIFDDGATFGLDRSYLIGRNPARPKDPSFEILKIYENNETLSRNHAELVLDGWSVKILDKGSTNGSFIWDTEQESWVRLEANKPTQIVSGTTVALGRRAFVYESVDQSPDAQTNDSDVVDIEEVPFDLD